ncbi:MAG: AI-2E family transporter [Clostridium sp.]
MKNEEFKKYLYYGMTAAAVIGVCIIFWYCIQNWSTVYGIIRTILGIVAPIIYGAVLAYLLSPIYNRVTHYVKKRLSKTWKTEKHINGAAKVCATVVSLVLLFAVVAGLIQMLIPQMIESIMGIKESFPVYLQNLYSWIQKILSDNPDIEKIVLDNLQSSVIFLENWMENSFTNIDIGRLGDLLIGFSSSFFGLLILVKNWLIGVIVMVYLLNIKDLLIAQAKKIVYGCFELRWANAIIKEMRFVHQVFGGFIIGKLVDSLIIGMICFICTSFMNTPYALLISVIVGVTNIIPFFGPFIGAIPSGFLVLLVDPVKCLYFLLFILLLQQFDGNILGPKILGNSTGISSFWVLFSILLFGGLFGFVGMIIGVPTFAVLYDLISRGIRHSLAKKRLSQNTADYENLDHIDEQNKRYIK